MLQVLDAQFHGGERVLDLVGDLLGHFAPGTLSFRLAELFGALFQLLDHTVVLGDELADFVLAFPLERLVLAQAEAAELGADLHQRPGNRVGHRDSNGPGDKQQEDVHIQQIADKAECGLLHTVVGSGERDTEEQVLHLRPANRHISRQVVDWAHPLRDDSWFVALLLFGPQGSRVDAGRLPPF